MPIKKILNSNRYTKDLLKKSQKTIKDLQKRLNSLKKKNQDFEEVKMVPKTSEASGGEMKMSLSVESVVKSAIAILLVLGFVRILGVIQDVIIMFLIALFLSAALAPAVDKLEQYKIPRPLGIVIVYIFLLGIIVSISASLAPVVGGQVKTLAGSIQDMVKNLVTLNPDSWISSKIQPYVEPYIEPLLNSINQNEVFDVLQGNLESFASTATEFGKNAIGVIIGLFNGVFRTILVLIITFFMILGSKSTHDFFSSLFPHRYSDYIETKTKQVSHSIGNWVRGQTLLAITMGVISYAIFRIIGIEFALTLALVSALAEFFPYLGPFITFTSAALVAFNQSPILLVWLAIAYVILQVVEGNIMVPLIVGRSVGLKPIVVIFAILSGAAIGYNIGGESIGLTFVGMILAVPVANIISIFLRDYTGKNK